MEFVFLVKGFYTWAFVGVSGIIIFFAALLAIFTKDRSEFFNKLLFFILVAPAIGTTLYLAGSTIYLNSISVTGGPVHYHADFEVWNCGEELDIVNPIGLSNKVGTPILHEHNDKRIHVEGVVLDRSEISLASFIKVIGGDLTDGMMTIPTTSGVVEMRDGQCANGMGQLQAFVYKFVYKTEGKSFTQTKLSNPKEYVLSSESLVPPGDCIIIEFDIPKLKTDKMCLQYKIKERLGEINYE